MDSGSRQLVLRIIRGILRPARVQPAPLLLVQSAGPAPPPASEQAAISDRSPSHRTCQTTPPRRVTSQATTPKSSTSMARLVNISDSWTQGVFEGNAALLQAIPHSH